MKGAFRNHQRERRRAAESAPHRAGLIVLILFVVAGAALAQRFRGGRGYRGWSWGDSGIIETEGGVPVDVDSVRTAREIASHSTETANWTNTPGFEKDVFTFARIIYRHGGYRSGSGWGWITDF